MVNLGKMATTPDYPIPTILTQKAHLVNM